MMEPSIAQFPGPRASPWSRHAVTTVAPPAQSSMAASFASADLVDAFAVAVDPAVAPGEGQEIEPLARSVLGNPAPWFRALLGMRDVLMAGFGVKTSGQLRNAAVTDKANHIDFFRILSRSDRELILGEDDRHLDFRLSILLRAAPGRQSNELVVTTIVHCHNWLGRGYLGMIMPFHRLVVRSNLSRASRNDWRVGRSDQA